MTNDNIILISESTIFPLYDSGACVMTARATSQIVSNKQHSALHKRLKNNYVVHSTQCAAVVSRLWFRAEPRTAAFSRLVLKEESSSPAVPEEKKKRETTGPGRNTDITQHSVLVGGLTPAPLGNIYYSSLV